jgi:site-specific recombinase XerD
MKTKQSFAEQITCYKAFLLGDYKPATIEKYSKAVLQYLEWKNASTSNQAKSKSSSIMEYLNPHFSISCRYKDLKSVRAALHLYYYHITGTEFQPSQDSKLNESIVNEVSEYEAYLSEVVGLAEATKIAHRQYLTRFLQYVFPNQKIEDPILTAATVQSFIATELRHLKPASKQRVIGIIRSYIRYLQFKGTKLDSGLLALPLHAPVWKLSRVPKTFEKEDIDNILSSYDLNSPAGIRDYTIALCFTELGLRASEVASIALDDFNWHEGKILIKKTKTRMERELPLPKKVGQAIVQYLQNARPATSKRTLFVRFSHHCGDAMGREQIRGTIRRAYARVGISPAITGTHILRHSKAKSMYEHGSSLKMIADILGHQSIDTTVIYTKVGRSALHCVTCPWPEASKPEVIKS